MGEATMKLEYKHERFDWGVLGSVDQRLFDERLMSILNTHSDEGWELKGCWHDMGLHVHLIFGRPVGEEQATA